MSSLALMRWLESAPERYDAGMRWITLGRVAQLHDAVAAAAAPVPGRQVLELGCGTGAVTIRLVDRGARVTAVEQNPEMLERARVRLAESDEASVEWLERTAAEIDVLPLAGFDAVVASLCLSEMSASERRFVLLAAERRLKPGGVLVVADEVVPRSVLRRRLHRVLRGPQAALAWAIAGSVSRPIRDLAGEVAAAGLVPIREQTWLLGGLAMIVAEGPR